MQGKQLLPKGEVFENEILAGTKGANQPTQQMSEPRDHGENLSGSICFEDPPHIKLRGRVAAGGAPQHQDHRRGII